MWCWMAARIASPRVGLVHQALGGCPARRTGCFSQQVTLCIRTIRFPTVLSVGPPKTVRRSMLGVHCSASVTKAQRRWRCDVRRVLAAGGRRARV